MVVRKDFLLRTTNIKKTFDLINRVTASKDKLYNSFVELGGGVDDALV